MKNILYLSILVSPLIFFTNLTRNPYIIQGTVLHISLLSILIIYIYKYLKNDKQTFYKTALDVPISVFVGTLILTWAMAFIFEHKINGFGRIPGYYTAIWSEGLRNNLYIIINCILTYYISANLNRDEKTIRKILFISYIVAFISSSYAIMQYFDIEPIWPQIINPYGIKRCVSTFGNPVFISSFLVLLIPLAFSSFIFTKSSYEKFLYAVLIIDMIFALFCTMARSSWLGLAVAFVILCAGFKETIVINKKWMIAVVIALCLVMLIPAKWENKTQPFGSYMINRVTSIASIEKSGAAAYQRFLIWLSASDMAKERPILGVGWGLFELYYPFYQQRYLIEQKLNFRTHANNAHNVFLENLSQTGIVGLGIFLWLVVCIVKFGFHQIKILKNGFQRTAAIGIFAGICGMLVDNILNVSLYFVIPGFFFWLNLGILASFGAEEKKAVPVHKSVKFTALIAGVLAVIAITSYVRIFAAEKNYFTGFGLVKRQDIPLERSVKYLEKAHSLHRLEVNNNYEMANAYARMSGQFRYNGAIEKADEYQNKAIWAYKEALAANPGYDEIYFNMATVYSQRKEHDLSVENYRRSVFINPYSLEGIMMLGNIYLTRGQYKEARDVYIHATLISPANKDAWNNLGYVDNKLSLKDEARDCYQKAISIDPNFGLAKKNLDELIKGR